MNVEWDAEIINDIPSKVIGWRSLEGSDVDNGGSVRFESDRNGTGTRVLVSMQYNPPAGQLGEWIASLFGDNPRKTIAEDLQRFKELMETGNVVTKASRKSRSAASPNARYSGRSGKVVGARCSNFVVRRILPGERSAVLDSGDLYRHNKGAGYATRRLYFDEVVKAAYLDGISLARGIGFSVRAKSALASPVVEISLAPVRLRILRAVFDHSALSQCTDNRMPPFRTLPS